jgi:hypothetical protein
MDDLLYHLILSKLTSQSIRVDERREETDGRLEKIGKPKC